ncbi:MAG: hypothetical protein E7493_02005 [Ruminococcus albus]|nr:hypothetical protein [Ruminococcus albus]
MSKEVMEIEKLIPTMTKEQIAQVCREISTEKSKPPIEKKSFGELFRDILVGMDITLDKFIAVTEYEKSAGSKLLRIFCFYSKFSCEFFVKILML